MRKILIPESVSDTLGMVITRERKKMGLTQGEFAEKLGVPQSAASRLENHKVPTTIAMLERVCAILGQPPHRLILKAERLLKAEKRKATK